MKRSAMAQRAGYWRTSRKQTLESNNQSVRLAAVNRPGRETTDEVAHGLWGPDYYIILNELEIDGYTAPSSSNQVERRAIPPTNLTENIIHSPRLLAASTREAARYLRAKAAEARPVECTAHGASLPKGAAFN